MSKHQILLIILIFFCQSLTGQILVDTILDKYKENNLGRAEYKLREFNNPNFYKKYYPENTNFDSLITIMEQNLVTYANKHPEKPALRSLIYSKIGKELVNDKKFSEGYRLLRQAKMIANQTGGIALYFSHHHYYVVFRDYLKLDSAIYYGEKMVDLSLKMSNDTLYYKSVSKLAKELYNIKANKRAREYYKKLVAWDKIPLNQKRDHLNTIGLTFRRQARYDSAVYYFEQALELSEENDAETWIGITKGNIGISYSLAKEYQKAIPFLRTGLHYSLKKKNRIGAMSSSDHLTRVYIEQKKYDSARYYVEKFDSLVKGTKHIYYRLDFFQTASQYHNSTGNKVRAYDFLNKHLLLRDSLDQANNIEQAKILNAQFEFDRQRKEIDELYHKQQSQNAESLRKTKLLIGAIAIILLALGFIYLLYRNYLQKHRLNEVLVTQKEEIEFKNELLGKANNDLEVNLETIDEQRKELEIQTEHLENINETKDKLFSIIGHDLRGPVNSLKGLLELLTSEAISPEEFIMFSSKLKYGVEHLHFTLNNLLEWANNQMRGIELNPKECNIHRLAQENVALLSGLAREKKINLKNEIPPETIIFADRDQIRLVLRNLISNAVKFTPENGSITVTSEVKENQLAVSIIDTGIGMSEENLKKLFKTTSHFTSHGTKGEKGTGLGLLLCKEMVEKNGGEIWVESEEGEGTNFSFSVPVL